MLALVDQDLAVVGEHDARALERTRCGPLEVDAGRTETAAVAGTLELVLGRQKIRRAAQMGARADERIEPRRVRDEIFRRPHEPDAELVLPALVDADPVFVREAGLELLRRLVE